MSTSPVNYWLIQDMPGVNTAAVATRAAAVGAKHIAIGISCGVNLFAALLTPLTVVIRDGVSGAGTILYRYRFTSVDPLNVSGINVVGSTNTAMTIEFLAAPGATNFCSVWLQGYDVVLA